MLHLDNISLTKVSLYSILGQLIEVRSLENANSNTLDLSNLESGLYLVVLENDSQQKTIKIVKQ